MYLLYKEEIKTTTTIIIIIIIIFKKKRKRKKKISKTSWTSLKGCSTHLPCFEYI